MNSGPKQDSTHSLSSKLVHERTGRPYFDGPNPSAKQRKRMPVEFHMPIDQWPVHAILRARGLSKEREYLVDWKINPLNGAPYKPSWIKKEDVEVSLIRAWSRRKVKATLTVSEPILEDAALISGDGTASSEPEYGAGATHMGDDSRCTQCLPSISVGPLALNSSKQSVQQLEQLSEIRACSSNPPPTPGDAHSSSSGGFHKDDPARHAGRGIPIHHRLPSYQTYVMQYQSGAFELPPLLHYSKHKEATELARQKTGLPQPVEPPFSEWQPLPGYR